MTPLVTGIHRFRAADFLTSHRLFELGGPVAQQRGALLIVCPELEADPHRLIPTNLAALYVLQNLGNIVVPGDGDSPPGSASIETALALYRPTDIVICGHAPCGILDLLGSTPPEEMPSVAAWLRHALRARTIVEQHYREVEDVEERRDVLARENVLVQLENLRTIPAAAHQLDRGELHLHGWLYRDGVVDAYDVHQGQFTPLAQ
jgi:carbonic anhydrase